MTTLRDKMKQEMILRGYSTGTQENYLRAVVKLKDHFNRNPAKLTEDEIKTFLLTLINKPLSDSTYNIHIHGLKFFYSVTSTVRYLRMTDKTRQLIQSPVDKFSL